MEWLQDFDISILLFIQEYIRVEAWDSFWKVITFLGNGGWFWLAFSFLLIILKKTRIIGVTSLLSIGLGALITNLILKNLVARIRPYELTTAIIPLIAKPTDYSFPSGHTTASFACACICYRMLPKRYGIPILFLAILIAFSRLYVGVHYPTDVAGGILVGWIGSWFAYRFINIVTEHQKVNQNRKKKR